MKSPAFLSFTDFKNDVAKGGKKIKQFAVKVGNEIQHEITTIDNLIYSFAITCIEDAITALTGLFKTIFSDIMKAVEFLSKLFDWEAIKQNHQAILTRVAGIQTSLRNYLTKDTNALKTRLHTFFQNLEQAATNLINQTDGQIGTSSISSSQANGNDPKQVFGTGGGYAQAKSFHSKVKDNVKSAATPIIPTTLPLTPAAVFSTLKDIVDNQIPAAIQPIATDLKKAITDFITGFTTLFTDPMAFVKNSLHDLLTLLADLAALILKACDLALEIVITVLADLVDTIFSLLTGSFQIPILSELFKLIFGSELRLLDLAAWVIAVPLTVVQNIAAEAKHLRGTAQDVFGPISMFTGGLVDAINDDLNYDPAFPLNWVDLAVGILTAGLGFPPDADFSNDGQIVYYALGFVPLILSGANIVNATVLNTLPRTEAQQAQVDAFNAAAYVWTGLWGVVLTILTAALGSSTFSSTTVKENITSNVGLMAKYFDFSFRPVTVLADVVCPTAAMFIGLLES